MWYVDRLRDVVHWRFSEQKSDNELRSDGSSSLISNTRKDLERARSWFAQTKEKTSEWDASYWMWEMIDTLRFLLHVLSLLVTGAARLSSAGALDLHDHLNVCACVLCDSSGGLACVGTSRPVLACHFLLQICVQFSASSPRRQPLPASASTDLISTPQSRPSACLRQAVVPHPLSSLVGQVLLVLPSQCHSVCPMSSPRCLAHASPVTCPCLDRVWPNRLWQF